MIYLTVVVFAVNETLKHAVFTQVPPNSFKLYELVPEVKRFGDPKIYSLLLMEYSKCDP